MGHAGVTAATSTTPDTKSQKVFYYTGDNSQVNKATQQDLNELARLLLRVYKKKILTTS